MNMSLVLVYLISFGIMYFIGTIVVFIYFRKPMIEMWQQKMMAKKGYGYVWIYGRDKRVREYFKDLKKDRVEIESNLYLIDPKKAKFKGNASMFEFREGIAEPIDVYNKDLIGTDSEMLDGFLLKLKSLAKLTSRKEVQIIMYLAAGACIAAAVAAVIGYTNYSTLQDMSKVILK